MIITVVSTTGTGKTLLSSFDDALKQAGVYNYNLIALSSVIPTGSTIKKSKHYITPPEECGYRLYVVKAEAYTSNSQKAIAAGVGWYQFKNNAGIFVEHHIEGLTAKSAKDALIDTIYTSLSDLCEFRGQKFHKKRAGISIAVSPPAGGNRCALTLAVYKSEPW